MKDESLYTLISYLAWWSYDYLCEKLDLTCKRNHISSFLYIFLSLIALSSLLLFFFYFNDLLIPRCSSFSALVLLYAILCVCDMIFNFFFPFLFAFFCLFDYFNVKAHLNEN